MQNYRQFIEWLELQAYIKRNLKRHYPSKGKGWGNYRVYSTQSFTREAPLEVQPLALSYTIDRESLPFTYLLTKTLHPFLNLWDEVNEQYSGRTSRSIK